jgi:iron-sulfur cluster repair protein YtfE (RIC family)
MPDTRLKPRKATDPLKLDHRHFSQLFRQFRKLGETAFEKKVDLFRILADHLAAHATLEERLFYPALEQSPPAAQRLKILEAREEHKIVRTLLKELAELGPEDDAFDAKMKVLADEVARHAREEEQDLFPLFNALPQAQRDPLVRRLAEREDEWGVGRELKQ